MCCYREGVFEVANCNKTEMTHAMLLVGYDTEAGKDYWIVKNRSVNTGVEHSVIQHEDYFLINLTQSILRFIITSTDFVNNRTSV